MSLGDFYRDGRRLPSGLSSFSNWMYLFFLSFLMMLSNCSFRSLYLVGLSNFLGELFPVLELLD